MIESMSDFRVFDSPLDSYFINLSVNLLCLFQNPSIKLEAYSWYYVPDLGLLNGTEKTRHCNFLFFAFWQFAVEYRTIRHFARDSHIFFFIYFIHVLRLKIVCNTRSIRSSLPLHVAGEDWPVNSTWNCVKEMIFIAFLFSCWNWFDERLPRTPRISYNLLFDWSKTKARINLHKFVNRSTWLCWQPSDCQ